MAITTLDGAIAGMQPTRFFHKAITPTLIAGKPQSLWGLAGIPGPGAFSTSLGGANLSSTSALVDGQLPAFDPGSGNSYLARLVADASVSGKLLLCDRLWHNGGFTAVTSAQTVSSSAWPARDSAGSTNGEGVLLALEYNATGAANSPTISVSYTNSLNVASKTGANIYATANSPAAGSFFPIGLQAGDTGVRSVQSVTLGAAPTAGTCNLVAYRLLASLEIPAAYTGSAIDLVTGGMPQLFNGTVPFLVFIPSTTAASYISGALSVTQG